MVDDAPAPPASPRPDSSRADAPGLDAAGSPPAAPDVAPTEPGSAAGHAGTDEAGEAVADPGPIVLAPLALQLDPHPHAEPAPAPAPVEAFTVPTIVEATPVPEVSSTGELAALAADAPELAVDAPALVGAAAGPAVAAPAAGGPRLPEVQPVIVGPVVEEVRVAPVVAAPTITSRRRRSRRGPKLVLVLLMLGGLVAAAIVFGRPYLFPSEFDEATAPYAEAVEAARGVEFTDPITVVAEAPDAFATRQVDALGADWERDAPVWRALGLLSGPVGAEQVAETLDGWQTALYSTGDGQVARVESEVGPQADAAVVEAMAAASLDQEFRWSPALAATGLDVEAETLAEVERQGRAVLADSTYAVAVDEPDPGPLVFLPPVLGYRALAPQTMADFERQGPTTDNPLASIGPGGPGPLVTQAPVPASPPTPVAGDTVTGSPAAADAAFWYLVLASYLDARTAHGASEAVVESSVTVADRAGRLCVYGTFAGGDVDQTARLRAGLEQWALTVPPELGATVSVQPDGTLQLLSCDPGEGFVHPSRLGVARELVAWRVSELATYDYLTAEDTGDTASGTRPDVEAAWALVAASSVPLDVAALPPDTPLDVIATTARVGVAAVLAPTG